MRSRRALIALLIAAGATFIAYTLTSVQVFEGLFGQAEYKTIDYRMRMTYTPKRETSDVVLVLFDSSSAAGSPYLSPFPRGLLATVIDGVARSGARAIGLDVYLDRLYPELNALDSGDVKLRAAIKRAGNVVLVGPTTRDTPRVFLPPDTFFAHHAAAVSSADLPTPFETIRDGLLTVQTPQGLVPSFALALYAKVKGLDLDSLLRETARKRRLDLPGLPEKYARLTEDQVQPVPIVFEGPPSRTNREDGAFRAYSAFAIYQLAQVGMAIPPEWVKDKVVILGSGFHESEQFRTPFYEAPDSTGTIYGWTYGPEVHANALQNMLSGRYAVPLAPPLVWVLLLVTAGVVAVIVFWQGVKWGAVSAVLLMLSEAIFAFLLFDQGNVVVPVIGPAIGLALSFLGSTSYVSIVEGREKRMIKGAFGKFVSPRVADQLMADPAALKLGGDRIQISMLFSDLAGFTSMSEMLDPQKLVLILNEYLHEMAELVKKQDGYVDKYIGDAVMALYGAPNRMDDHATRACRTALAMQKRLDELNKKWRLADPSWQKLKVRIGLNTGDPVVGNIGGEEKIQYTALGDAVNLAARLEPACKTYGVGIMLAQQTREEAGATIQVRELDLLAVYGKKEPIRVYELLAMADEDIGPERREALEQYETGLAAFRRRDFELALQYFKAALEIDPGDGPSALYVERCEEYMVNPPPADWDFVERRQVK